MTIWKSVPLLLLLVVLTACGTRHPLGITDDEWEAMSVEQRIQAREQQAALDKAAAERRAEEARLREAEERRLLMELEVRRGEAAYGERVQCVLSRAEAYLGREWREMEPIALDLVTGIEVAYELVQIGPRSRYSTDVYAAFDGQTVSLCRYSNSSRQCARMPGTQRDYRRGIQQPVVAEDFLRGQLRCNLVY